LWPTVIKFPPPPPNLATAITSRCNGMWK
jgi:hypothetical protein